MPLSAVQTQYQVLNLTSGSHYRQRYLIESKIILFNCAECAGWASKLAAAKDVLVVNSNQSFLPIADHPSARSAETIFDGRR